MTLQLPEPVYWQAMRLLKLTENRPKVFQSEDAAKQIRGKINSPVDLVLMRSKQRIKVKVVRAEIPIRAVQTAKMLDSDVGYIRLSSFISQQANKEMRDALVKSVF